MAEPAVQSSYMKNPFAAFEAEGKLAPLADGTNVLAAHALWLRCFAFGVRPLLTLCGRDGTARLVEWSEAERSAAYLLHWKAGR